MVTFVAALKLKGLLKKNDLLIHHQFTILRKISMKKKNILTKSSSEKYKCHNLTQKIFMNY